MAKFPRIFFLVVGWIGITIIALSVISVVTGTEITKNILIGNVIGLIMIILGYIFGRK